MKTTWMCLCLLSATAAVGAEERVQLQLREGAQLTLVAESCDVLVSIPMKGRISSLNASAAAAILLYEAVRQRN